MEECSVCYEIMVDVEPLGCGHKFHTECLEKHFKPECPVCRKKHNRVLPKGKAPKSSPGRTARYVRSDAAEQRIVIDIPGESQVPDKLFLESILTKKHRGEYVSAQDNIKYTKLIKKIGSFTVSFVSDSTH